MIPDAPVVSRFQVRQPAREVGRPAVKIGLFVIPRESPRELLTKYTRNKMDRLRGLRREVRINAQFVRAYAAITEAAIDCLAFSPQRDSLKRFADATLCEDGCRLFAGFVDGGGFGPCLPNVSPPQLLSLLHPVPANLQPMRADL